MSPLVRVVVATAALCAAAAASDADADADAAALEERFGADALPPGVTVTSRGVAVTTAAGAEVVVEVGAAGAFRLGVSFDGPATQPIPSPSLGPNRASPPFKPLTKGGFAGIKTSFGALLANASGAWQLLDAAGAVLASSGDPAHDRTGTGSVTYQVPSMTGEGVSPAGQPCLGNGQFGPPYVWDSGAKVFAFAVSPWDYDPDSIHCYPASFRAKSATGSDEEGNDTLAPAQRRDRRDGGDTCASPQANTDVGEYSRSKAAPDGLKNHTLEQCCGACNKASDCAAWVRTSDGKPDGSGMNCWLFSCVDGTKSRPDRTFGGSTKACKGPSPGPPPPPAHSGWWGMGNKMDWYLAPAPTGYSFLDALYNVTGAPLVPPRHGMAFMATYWGYKTMQDVESDMHQFREGSYPIDSFIMDYDWFGPEPCGDTPIEQGGYACGDFGYKKSFWANQSFTQPNGTVVATKTAADVLAHFHGPPLHMRFAGIRKPRSYSNVNLSNTSGWLLPDKDSVGAGGNNWNYSSASMRDWYAKGHFHFLQDGIDYWWNDEGETQWFTYFWMNVAQQQQWTTIRPNKRHFTINRAFQPGMQRFPAITWTGDGQDCSHSNVIKFQNYGQLYTACDMTSPDATVLVRQYQNAVFLPIMRVHQMHGVPRFPFLWGTDEHHATFREALNTRYHLLPYFYSLAHRAHRRNLPIVAPASYEFEGQATLDLSEQIMVGGDLVPADVSTSHSTQGENSSSVVLPPGAWFAFNSSVTVQGNQTLTRDDLALSEFPVYARPGTILPTNAAVVQRSDDIGGLLLVQVYSGRSNAFDMVEDDGDTLDYAASGGDAAATKTTTWTWDDGSKTLSWSSAGGFAGNANTFTSVQAQLFEPGSAKLSAVQPLAKSGKISF